jgi:hypothetical protein
MVAELIPNLKTAWIDPAQAKPVSFGDYVAPNSFSAWFIFKSPQTKSDKNQGISREWDLFLDVTVSELGSPELKSVLVKGSRSTNLLQPDRQGVERWQLKVVEQYRTQLLTLALRVAVETRSPRHSGDVADFAGFWEGNPDPLNTQELKALQKLIGQKIRQKITGEVLAEVAKIYTSEAQALGGKPVKAVQDHFGGSYRSAQDYVRKAREEGYLPQTTRGKVTIKHIRARKDKDDNKKQS